MEPLIFETRLDNIPLLHRGKVRDIYDLGDMLLIVATDRISAFDVVMPNPIPNKGKILTSMSRFWFEKTNAIIPNHLITAEVADYPDALKRHSKILDGRSMLVRKATPLPIECIVRGYLSGSGWQSYQRNGVVCGIRLPKGLAESDKLPVPIFTPSTKAELGEHDINIDFKQAVSLAGKEIVTRVREASLALYLKGLEIAEHRGIIIADTKFEFGLINTKWVLIDEVLTPDSSRFWPKDEYAPGKSQQSFDKQYLRDYLVSIGWDKRPPAPELPKAVIENTEKKYAEALSRLTAS
ncbi:MAG: phosphoribosylaminoimidazolesuccinocarboxamide synthase [Pseudomonadota bacterium]